MTVKLPEGELIEAHIARSDGATIFSAQADTLFDTRSLSDGGLLIVVHKRTGWLFEISRPRSDYLLSATVPKTIAHSLAALSIAHILEGDVVVFDNSVTGAGMWTLPIPAQGARPAVSDLTFHAGSSWTAGNNALTVFSPCGSAVELQRPDDPAQTELALACEQLTPTTNELIKLHRDGRKGVPLLFIHGGPGIAVGPSTRGYLLQLVAKGFDVYISNYPSSDGFSPDTTSLEQASAGLDRLANLVKRDAGADPAVLVESFGWLVFRNSQLATQPVKVFAVSPVVDGPTWLTYQKEMAAKSGLPWARWPNSAHLLGTTPDFSCLPVERLVIVNSADDVVLGAQALKRSESIIRCGGAVERASVPGSEHASEALYDVLFRRLSP